MEIERLKSKYRTRRHKLILIYYPPLSQNLIYHMFASFLSLSFSYCILLMPSCDACFAQNTTTIIQQNHIITKSLSTTTTTTKNHRKKII